VNFILDEMKRGEEERERKAHVYGETVEA